MSRSAALRKSPPGVSGVGLAHGGVPTIQRARILAALVEVARERGAGRVTVAHIVARSGVSRRTFYEMFEDRDACFLAAFQDAVQRAAVRVAPAFQREASGGGIAGAGDANVKGAGSADAGADGRAWQVRIRAGLLALLEFLDDEPGLAGLCVVDALGGGPAALEARAQVFKGLVDAIDEGRGVAKAGLGPSRVTAEGVVGGALAVLFQRLAERRPFLGSAAAPCAPRLLAEGHTRPAARAAARSQPLVGLLNVLMSMIVLPYLGPGAAAREAARPAPKKARRGPPPSPSNPLEGLDMRLTYRTVRVLVVIADSPAASNRQVADAAGVHDQGQISKLLARLEHLGLIENGAAGVSRGEPNAWRLTPRGLEVARTINRQAAPSGHEVQHADNARTPADSSI
jgi:AcrR family transcriptional regulator